MKRILAFAGIFAAAALLVSQPAPRTQVGPQPDGSFLLNSGWRLQPAGKQIPLDELRYWSVVRQEPYADASASLEADKRAGALPIQRN